MEASIVLDSVAYDLQRPLDYKIGTQKELCRQSVSRGTKDG